LVGDPGEMHAGVAVPSDHLDGREPRNGLSRRLAHQLVVEAILASPLYRIVALGDELKRDCRTAVRLHGDGGRRSVLRFPPRWHVEYQAQVGMLERAADEHAAGWIRADDEAVATRKKRRTACPHRGRGAAPHGP